MGRGSHLEKLGEGGENWGGEKGPQIERTAQIGNFGLRILKRRGGEKKSEGKGGLGGRGWDGMLN